MSSIAMTAAGFSEGCGGAVPSGAVLDDEAKARVEQAQENMKRAHEKK